MTLLVTKIDTERNPLLEPFRSLTKMPRERINAPGRNRVFQWGDMNKIADWLRGVMAEKGITQADLARMLGVERQTIYKVLNGKRRLNSDELLKLQRELGAPVSPPPLPKQEIKYIKVVAEVAGGVWREVTTFDDFVEYEIPIVQDPRWPTEALKALVVRGESINRQARDGDIVLTLAIGHAPRGFASGDWVVVERQRGNLVETTVKRIELDMTGEWQLLHDSTDPRFQDPVPLDGDGAESTRVVAFVLDFIRPATKL